MTEPKTLYGKYILERENKYILEYDTAFLTYELCGDILMLNDCFIEKEHRGSNVLKFLFEKAKYVAIREECTTLMCHVSLKDPNFIKNVIKFERLGFQYCIPKEISELIFLSIYLPEIKND